MGNGDWEPLVGKLDMFSWGFICVGICGPVPFFWEGFVAISFSLTFCCPKSVLFPLYVNLHVWLPLCDRHCSNRRWGFNLNPPPLHPQRTWLIWELTPKPLSDWFVTHHWLPVLGCDHPSRSDSVSSAPGPVTLVLREPEGLVSQFWWPVQCRPSSSTVLTVCSGFELAQ